MKKVLFFLLLSVSIYAREDSTQTMCPDKAIMFSFNNLTINTYNGGIGFKYFISKNGAVVVNLSFSYRRSETEPLDNQNGAKSTLWTPGFSAGYLYYSEISKSLYMYTGVAAGITYSNSKSESLIPVNHDPANNTDETITKTIGYSLTPCFGVEYFFNESISVGGQYNIAFGYNESEHTRKIGTSPEVIRNNNETRIGISTGTLVLSIYF